VAERRGELRAADSDRQFVAERLRTALNEGRLNLTEYDERLQQTYAAKTYGELDQILDDLPGTVSAENSRVSPVTSATPGAPGTAGAPATPAPARRGGGMPAPLLAIWGSWLTTTLICMVIYLATDFGGYPWPVWVAGPWGAILVARTVMAYASGDPSGYMVTGQQRRAREQARREARWQRRQDRWR
jgi:hypothetical protein